MSHNSSRRNFLTTTGFATLMTVAAVASGCAPLPSGTKETVISSTSQPSNFLVIVVDDMGMADIGSFGGEIDTPNLNALATSGIRLTNFHTSPVCSATRAMLLTGVDNHKAGLGNMAEEMAPNQRGMPGHEGELNDSVATVPELLKSKGYRSYMTGKWHLGMSEQASPFARGFDRSFTLLSGGASHYPDMKPAYSPDPDGKAPYRRNADMVTSLPDSFRYSSQFYVDEMIGYLKQDRAQKKPFFAYLAFTAPHWPLQAPAATIAKYKGRFDAGYDVIRDARLKRQKQLGIIPKNAEVAVASPKERPWTLLSEKERQTELRAMEIYAAMIDEVDQNVGRLIDYLRASGQLENTVVIFISDNGTEGHDLDETWPADQFPEIRKNIDSRHDFSLENMGAENSYVLYGPNWARAGSPALRLYKGFPTEGGTRVSAFVNYRGFKKGVISDRFFSVKDIAPTLLAMAGVQHPAPKYNGHNIEPMSGFDMRTALASGAGNSDDQPRVEGGEIMGKYMIRQGQWKMVHIAPPHGNGSWQLYDLENDLAENKDLSVARPDIVKTLTAEWERYSKENGVILPNEVSGY